jgi:hypothetical protein
MAVQVRIKDIESGNTIEMSFEPDKTIEDLIISAADYWNKRSGAYILKYRKKVLAGKLVLSELKLGTRSVLELLPDPEGG